MSTNTIGRYQIKFEIGRGGMATVYAAHDPHFDRDVALKLLPREVLQDTDVRARFEREAKTIAMLEHPAIVPVYDYGEDNGQLYLVMRLMKGGSLTDRLKGGPLSLDEAARITERLAGALDTAHAKGIIHRDLKPGNVLFDEYNNPYISDFGIAKLTQASVVLTRSNAVVGTPAYMSPEQIRGEPDIDQRSDIYAFGAILFEMLTGRLPYEGDTPYSIMLKHMAEPVPRVLDSNPDLPPACQTVIERAMAKERTARFQTAAEMVQALDHVLKGEAAMPLSGPRGASQTRRWKLVLIGVMTLVGITALGGLIAALASSNRSGMSTAAAFNTTVPGGRINSSLAATPIVTTQMLVAGVSSVPPTTIATSTATSPPTLRPSPTDTLTPTPTPSATPTPTPLCPAVSGQFTEVWLAVQDKIGCAVNEASSTAGTEETFQGGWMYWRKDNDRIYAVYQQGGWRPYPDLWKEGNPAFSCLDANTPAQSPPTPARGFGKIWCTVAEVRQGLEQATDSEHASDMLVQSFDRGFMLRTNQATWIFYDNGSWERR